MVCPLENQFVNTAIYPMHPQQISILVIATLGALSTFLPWIHVSVLGGSVSGADTNQYLPFLLFGISIALVFMIGPADKALKGNALYACMLTAGIAAAIGLFSILDVRNAQQGPPGSEIRDE